MSFGAAQPTETTRLLAQSARLARDTEDIADSTADELSSQREKTEEINEYLEAMSSLTASARQSIRGLRHSVIRKKMYLWGAIIGLAFANVAVIAILIRNNGRLFYHA